MPEMLSSLVSSKTQKIIEGVILALLTLVIYLFTINPMTKPYAVYVAVASLLLLGLVNFFLAHLKPKEFNKFLEGRTEKILIFALFTAVLLWVGNTGWFLSPFFYLLYLLAISLAFLFSTSVSFSFIIVLIGVLLPNVGSVNSQFDLVSLLALFLMLPLSYFLRKEYLRRKEKEKKILILEEERKSTQNKVDEILSNKITKIAVDLREPINDIRLLALMVEKKATIQEKENVKKILASSEKALKRLQTFEEETTGRMLVKSQRLN